MRTWPPNILNSHLQALNLTDGTWSVYDPASRLVSPVSLITGTHKHYLNLTFSSTAKTIATGVTYYRRIRDRDGNYPTNTRGAPHRISASWASPVILTTGHRLILAVGYSNGIPSTSSAIIRLYGYQDGDASNRQVNGRMSGTAGTSTWTIATTAVNSGRTISILLQRLSLNGTIQIIPATGTDGHRDTTNTLGNTYTYSAAEEFGIENDIYEYIFIGCDTASGALSTYIAGETGLIGPNDSGYHYTPEWGGAQEPLHIYVDGDSEWFGGTGGGGVGSYPGVQRAFQEFCLRKTGRERQRPVRFVGFTGSGIGAPAKYGLDGQVDTGASSGRLLETATTQATGRATNLSAAGRDLLARGGQPDIWLILLGINDAQDGKTATQMRTFLETTAAAVKAVFPDCEVWFAAIASATASYNTLVSETEASLPAEIDRVVDFHSWWTSAFRASVGDGHPSVPANPTTLAAWNLFLMDPAGAIATQHGVAAFAYHLFKAVYGIAPPLLSTEVAPE